MPWPPSRPSAAWPACCAWKRRCSTSELRDPSDRADDRTAPVAGHHRGVPRRMPVTDATPIVTLREGGTPLIHSEFLSELTGCEVHLKFDGSIPTGSFKDRGMTMAISKAKEDGAQAVICASTGNTSAAAAAYAAKAGMTAGVIVPKGKIAMGKLAQALVHGAKVIQIDGNFDQALIICREL